MVKEKILLDTDLGADCDDAITIALLSNLKKANIVDVVGISISSTRKYARNTLDKLLDYFGLDTEVAQMQEPGIKADNLDSYCYLFKDYISSREYLDSVSLMRKAIAKEKDITIVAVGPLVNIERLIESCADEYSSLNGKELINTRVKALYIMGGSFTKDYPEWNIAQDINSAKKVFNEITIPIYCLPSEEGDRIKTGLSSKQEGGSPVWAITREFSKKVNNGEINDTFERESWDPLTLLATVNKEWIIPIKKGTISIDDKGKTFICEDEGNHRILSIKNKQTEMQIKKFINGNILKNPRKGVYMEKQLNKKQLEAEKRKQSKITSILFPSDVDDSAKDNDYIVLHRINKIYDNDVQAVFDFNLNIKKNEFVVFVGPSGCGKSTTLRMIAGLEEITSGDLFINSKYSNELAPKNRDIAMVFQSYALYPHMNVYKNLSFGLKIRKFPTVLKDKEGNDVLWIDKKAINETKRNISDCNKVISICEKEAKKLEEKKNNADENETFVLNKKNEYYAHQKELAEKAKMEQEEKLQTIETTQVPKIVYKHLSNEEIDKRVKEAAEILEITDYLQRKPKALSGGQRQRVALGRAIVRNAAAFLMDEPLSNLDAKLRVQMRSEIVNLHRKIGATTIYVTHDQTEAMTMADRIVVMKDGMIQQIGTPKDIYSKPKNLFVAQFIGAPSMNIIEGTCEKNKITLFDKHEVTLSDLQEKSKTYYQQEIKRLTGITNELSDLLKDIKNPRYEIYLEAKEQAEEFINSAKDKLSGTFNVLMGIRPEDLLVQNKADAETFEVEVSLVELLGSEYYIHGIIDGKELIIKSSIDVEVKQGEKIFVKFSKKKIHLFDKDTERSIY